MKTRIQNPMMIFRILCRIWYRVVFSVLARSARNMDLTTVICASTKKSDTGVVMRTGMTLLMTSLQLERQKYSMSLTLPISRKMVRNILKSGFWILELVFMQILTASACRTRSPVIRLSKSTLLMVTRCLHEVSEGRLSLMLLLDTL